VYRKDVVLVPNRGTGNDVFLGLGQPGGADVYLRSLVGANANDVFLHRQRYDTADAAAAPPEFPTQFAGFRIQKTGSMIELSLVAEADAPAGMGGVLKFRKGGTTYVAYLVEVGDANASPLRIRTTTGTKAVRLKT
jgi:hypothetical protein